MGFSFSARNAPQPMMTTDPPSRVGGASATAHGTVSFNPAGTDDWVSAVRQTVPMTNRRTSFWTDKNGSRAPSCHIGSAAGSVPFPGKPPVFSFL